ncbi:TetR/AcrR family transcriptional regulator [Prauserella alba]|uniref:TetR/AcrR family transcriptional regulator n=1 Tax=Prauserella alba TaxID=176898 RepID=A0ABP4G7B0_9PSEU|nr:TetR/AcrR family transcriptional regulator [Prauserella alba]MCP2180894.1 transcriptional regulator, TetR family [Prauserella alba]
MSTEETIEPTRSASSRVQRKRGRRIQEILTAAAELFGERGYDAVSLEDVAERLDVTKGSLYYYFSSKDELGTAAIETLGTEWTARLQKLVDGTSGSAADRLRALIHEHVLIAVRDHPAALQVFLVPRRWPHEQRESIKELRQRHDRLFRALIEEGVAAGEFTVTGVDTVLQCMHAAMSQAPVWCADLPARAQYEAVDEVADTLMMLVGQAPPE